MTTCSSYHVTVSRLLWRVTAPSLTGARWGWCGRCGRPRNAEGRPQPRQLLDRKQRLRRPSVVLNSVVTGRRASGGGLAFGHREPACGLKKKTYGEISDHLLTLALSHTSLGMGIMYYAAYISFYIFLYLVITKNCKSELCSLAL